MVYYSTTFVFFIAFIFQKTFYFHIIDDFFQYFTQLFSLQ